MKKSITNLMMLMVIIVVFVCIGYFMFGAAGCDDCYITYNAALNLSQTGNLVNINLDRIEQGTSLLHVLCLALLHKILQCDMAILGFVFSIVCGIATIIMIYFLAKMIVPRFNPLLSACYLAVFGYFIYWSFGGLESTLVALCYMFFMYAFFSLEHRRYKPLRYILLYISILLLILVRPEMIFILGLAGFFHCVMLFVTGTQRNIKVLIYKYAPIAASAVLFFCMVSLFRYLYFHRIFPLPVYAKSSGIDLYKLYRSLLYVMNDGYKISLITLMVFIVFNFVYTGVKKKLDEKFSFIFSLCMSNLAFIFLSGGDWMEGGRFFIPVIPMIILLFLMTLDNNTFISFNKYIITVVIVLILTDSLVFTIAESKGVPFFFRDSIAKRYYIPEKNDRNYSFCERMNKPHLRDMHIITEMNDIIGKVSTLKEEPVTVLTRQMGMVPYYIKETHGNDVRFYDRCGLTTAEFFREDKKQLKTNGGLQVQNVDIFNILRDKYLKEDPDILYDMEYCTNLEYLLDRGYVLFYLQIGNIVVENTKKTNIGQLIMIREDLYTKLNLSPEYYEWTKEGIFQIQLTVLADKYPISPRVKKLLL